MMYIAGKPYPILAIADIERFHRSALRILSEMGMQIQNRSLLEALACLGLPVDFSDERVRFPAPFVEQFLTEAEKHDWENAKPRVSATAGIYHGLYHDPLIGKLVPWTEEHLKNYTRLAKSLPNVGAASMLGCRLPVPGELEPLYERYHSWQIGATEGGSICTDEICPYLYDFYHARAQNLGKPVLEVFKATVYLVPPMKLGRHEAFQVEYFRQRGLRVEIGGSMVTMGATAPVTLAGAITLNLAEQLALRILEWALWGEKRLFIYTSISVLDMRTTIRPYGRPEMAFANLVSAQIARYFGAAFDGHAGLSDAKLPSPEAGAQKALTAIPTLMAGGSLWMDAGLLGIDEVCSPIQLVLDDEFLEVLRQFTKEFTVDEEAIGVDNVLAVGPGGHFLDQEHTARFFRGEQWNPRIWSRKMLGSWLAEGQELDVDRARGIVLETYQKAPEPGGLPSDLDGELRRIIECARWDLLG